MSDPNFSAIRARLRYSSIEEFMEGYGRYISRGGMFVPMAAQKLKPVGTTVRFQFLLADDTSAMLGEGIVRQLKGLDQGSEQDGLVGMLVKFTKLSPDSKKLVDQVVDKKAADKKKGTEEQKTDTGVLAADQAQSLVNQSSESTEGGDDVVKEEQTAERSVEEFRQAHAASQDAAEAHESPADDDANLSWGEPSDGPEDSADDQEPEVNWDKPAEELAEQDESEELSWGDSDNQELAEQDESEELSWGDSDDEESTDEDDELSWGDSDDEELDDQIAAGVEEALAFGSEPEEESPPSVPEPAPEPPSEPEAPASEPASGAETGPKALKETEGGIKIMAFDDDEDIDELATKEFEEFASGGEDDVDDMFDNIFGGGGNGEGDGLFGGGGDDGDDFFGDGDEGDDGEGFFGAGAQEDDGEDFFGGDVAEAEESEIEKPVDEVEQEATPEQEVDKSAPVADEEMPEQEAEEQEVEDEEEEEQEEEEQEEEERDAISPEGGDDDGEVKVSVRETEGDSSEHIRSLLSMEDDEEPEMTLNLGGGSTDDDEPEEADDDEESDDMASLLASAQQEIDGKKDKKDDEDDKDILDELLGDDELPPPGAAASPFEMPQPAKKKKKGFISKFFNKD